MSKVVKVNRHVNMDDGVIGQETFVPLVEVGGLPSPRLRETPVSSAAEIGTSNLFTAPPLGTIVASEPGIEVVCPGCTVRLLLPSGHLAALCPACGVLATVQTRASVLAPTAAPVSQSLESRAITQQLGLAPSGNHENNPSSQGLASRRPSAHRIERTGKFSYRPLGIEDIPVDKNKLVFEELLIPRQVNLAFESEKRSAAALRIWKLALLLGILALLVVGGGVAAYLFLTAKRTVAFPAQPETTSQDGGMAALETLKLIFSSRDPDVVAKHVTGGVEMIPQIASRISQASDYPSFDTEPEIVAIEMNADDQRRGLSGYRFTTVRAEEFTNQNPIIPAEMALGVSGLDLLQGATVLQAKLELEPRQALAFFIQKGKRQLLDWDLFFQTWDRTLRDFCAGHSANEVATFRVILNNEPPVFENGESVDDHVIRLQDPLHTSDTLRIKVKRSDQPEVLMRPSERALEKEPSAVGRPRTATVVLRRNQESGEITIDEIICWQYLGLGGVVGNLETP